MKTLLLTILSAVLAPIATHAQDSIPPVQAAQVSVVGRGDIKVTPDRASIEISVQTRATTAQAAGAENATKQQSVLAVLRSLGLSADQLSTIGYNVYPEQQYEQGKQPVIVAYTVTNTILVDVRKLTQVGPIIDAALSHGANAMSALQFYASNAAEARRSAIAAAVESARSDADAAARAAHGSLGPLLEISIGSPVPTPPRPIPMMRLASDAAVSTPITPGDETVSVEVSTRWRLLLPR